MEDVIIRELPPLVPSRVAGEVKPFQVAGRWIPQKGQVWRCYTGECFRILGLAELYRFEETPSVYFVAFREVGSSPETANTDFSALSRFKAGSENKVLPLDRFMQPLISNGAVELIQHYVFERLTLVRELLEPGRAILYARLGDSNRLYSPRALFRL